MRIQSSYRRVIALFLALVFMLSFARPAVVFAEDSPPTEPAPVVEETQTTPTEDQVVPTEVPAQPTEESAALVEEQVAPTEGPAAPVEEQMTPAEVMAALPEGVDLNIVDENGETLPLASSEAAEVLLMPDPSYVCDGGTHAGTQNFVSINAAIADMATCISGGGTVGDGGKLTVAAGTFTEDVVFDNRTLTGFTSIVGAGSGLTFLNGSMESLFLTNFLFQGFTVNNVASDYINFVGQNGTISLNDINSDVSITLANGVPGPGNTESYVLTDVNVSNPNGYGIYIDSGDSATLTHVTANNNYFDGADIYDLYNLTVQGNENGDSSFDGNGMEGLNIEYVVSEDPENPGLIDISDTSASDNDGIGLSIIDSCDTPEESETEICADIAIDNVTMDDNDSAGLWIEQAGDVSITDSTVNGNNQYDDDYVNGIFDAQDVTITNSHFENNGSNEGEYYGYGLIVDWGEYDDNYFDAVDSINAPGDMTVSGSFFNGNEEEGLIYNGWYCSEWYYGEFYTSCDNWEYGEDTTVDISDTEMRNNGERGVEVYAAGTSLMDGLTLDANGWDNIGIFDVDDVTITDTVTTDSYCDGIYTSGNGDITLSGITSTGNGWGDGCTGAYLEDTWGDIDISDSTFNNNSSAGLNIEYTEGNTYIENVTAMGNGFYHGEGEYSDNSDGTGIYLYDLYGDATITDSTVNKNYYGVYIEEIEGNVTLTKVDANGNEENGLYIEGYDGEQNVEIYCSNVKGNGSGIYTDYVYDVTLSGVTATGNGDFDMDLNYDGELIELSGCKPADAKEKEKEIIPEGKIVPVNGGESVPLECSYIWTMLVLPEQSEAKFDGFCGLNASFNHIPGESLPGEVPDGYTYVGGYSDGVGGAFGVIPNSGHAQLSLVIPESVLGKELVVLFWDAGASKWVEIPAAGNEGSFSASDPVMKVLSGVKVSGDGKVNFSGNFTGTFVVVSK
jgi:hypothetical protein